jgi:hypothetical protein
MVVKKALSEEFSLPLEIVHRQHEDKTGEGCAAIGDFPDSMAKPGGVGWTCA